MRCRTCQEYDLMGYGQYCPCNHGDNNHMQPPTKDQTDIGKDEPTIDASDGTNIIEDHAPDRITINKDMARQEFKQDADLNYMLSRFGITPERGAPTYGMWDDTLDLQQAIAAVTEAREAYADLPQELKNKFGSMEELLAAYHNGSLVIKDGEVPIPPKSETEILRERIAELERKIPA